MFQLLQFAAAYGLRWGIKILGSSSDHLMVESSIDDLLVGQEVKFHINYSALLGAMTSPFVSKKFMLRKGPYC